MKRFFLLVVVLTAVTASWAGEMKKQTVRTQTVGDINIRHDDSNGWNIKTTLSGNEEQEAVRLDFTVGSPQVLMGVQWTSAQKAYVFTYFNNSDEKAGMYLAYSYDGYNWTAANDNKPVMKPMVGKDKVLRDPSVCQGPDGTFHMVWTTGWNDKCIGYASSKDLLNWSEQKTIPVMEKFPTTRNTWAPELFYDKKSKTYYIFWASTVPGAKKVSTDGCISEDNYNHRIYYTTTRDFKSFAKTRLFFNPKFNAIDANIIQDEETGEYIMFVKNENLEPAEKNIRITRTNSLKKGFPIEVSVPISGEEWAEGPAPLAVGDDIVCYWDCYGKHQFEASVSHDKGKTWEDVTEKVTLPKGISHGTAIAVDKAVVDALVKRFGTR